MCTYIFEYACVMKWTLTPFNKLFKSDVYRGHHQPAHLARQLELVKLKSRCAGPCKLVCKFWLDFGKRHLLHVWINFEMCLMNFAALLRLGITLYVIFMFRSVYIVRTPPSLLPPPFLFAGRGREAGFEPPTKFSKRGGLKEFQFLERGCWERGGWRFPGGGCNFYIKNKLKSEIFNDKKVYK